jgi:DNA repair protein RecO (recombination protein O)
MSTPVNRLYNFNLTDESFKELKAVTDSFRKEYVDREFKSLEILSSLM